MRILCHIYILKFRHIRTIRVVSILHHVCNSKFNRERSWFLFKAYSIFQIDFFIWNIQSINQLLITRLQFISINFKESSGPVIILDKSSHEDKRLIGRFGVATIVVHKNEAAVEQHEWCRLPSCCENVYTGRPS